MVVYKKYGQSVLLHESQVVCRPVQVSRRRPGVRPVNRLAPAARVRQDEGLLGPDAATLMWRPPPARPH